MNVMQRFTLRSLRRNKKRTVVTIIGVVISAAMITAVATLLSSFLDLFARAEIADSGNWHAQIMGVPSENIETVTQSDIADKAFLSRHMGFAELEGSAVESKPFLYLQEYSADGFEQMSVRLVSGRLPEAPREVVISDSIKRAAGVDIAVGDTLELQIGQRIHDEGHVIKENRSLNYHYSDDGYERTLAETLVPDRLASLTVVGIMERPGTEPSWAAGCTVLGFLDASALTPEDKVDVYFTVRQLSKNIFEQTAALAEQAGAEGGATYNTNLLRLSGVVRDGDNLFVFLYGLTSIILALIIIASISLIYNAFAISVSERSKQLGLLASVGATKRQKRQSIYTEGLFIGLIGVPLGLLAGIGGIGVTIAALQSLLNDLMSVPEGITLQLVVSPLALAVAALCSAVTLFISVYKPALRASKIMPIDAIRQSREITLTRKRLRTSRLTRALFGFEAEIALKNLKRSRKKYRATIVSLIISLVLFLTVSMYTHMLGTLTDSVSSGVNFDLSVSYSELTDASRDTFDDRVAALDVVNQMTQAKRLPVFSTLEESQLTDYSRLFVSPDEDGIYKYVFALLCPDARSFEQYALAAGVPLEEYTDAQAPKAILINYGQSVYYSENGAKKVAGDIMTVKPGDTLSVRPGEQDHPIPITIGALTDERPMGVRIQDFWNAALVVSPEVWEVLLKDFADNERIFSALYITTDNDQLLEKQINQLKQQANMPDSYIYIHNVQSAARSEQNIQTLLGVFVYGFLVLISLICIANIFNTVSTNISLRRREFAMLRSVGLTPSGFNKLVRFESIFYGLKGLLYGLPLSVAAAYLLQRLQGSILETAFTLPWVSYGFAVLMVLIIVFTTMMYATHRIKKENIIEAIRDENT